MDNEGRRSVKDILKEIKEQVSVMILLKLILFKMFLKFVEKIMLSVI